MMSMMPTPASFHRPYYYLSLTPTRLMHFIDASHATDSEITDSISDASSLQNTALAESWVYCFRTPADLAR